MPESTTAETESNCFGCAPSNPIGLHLDFERDGDVFTTRVKLGADYESFPGVVHGGIVGTILDETLAQAVYRSGRVSAFTTGLRIRYARPMETDTEHTAWAEIVKRDEISVRATGRVETGDGEIVAVADGTFYLLTDDVLGQNPERIPAELIKVLRSANGPAPQGD
ncbi:PaaI family thioesterase [Streptomyces sp. NPDC050610]|uniref:PaaI family thioesterase n=1 Tax=Streptomyces sp. NPDC050610 TaxID=3157097 RepID=UPI00342ED92F